MNTDYLKSEIKSLIKDKYFNKRLEEKLNFYKKVYGITTNISIEQQILLEDFIYNYFLIIFYMPTIETNKLLILNAIQDDEDLNDWFMEYVVL